MNGPAGVGYNIGETVIRETSWTLQSASGNVLVSGGQSNRNNPRVSGPQPIRCQTTCENIKRIGQFDRIAGSPAGNSIFPVMTNLPQGEFPVTLRFNYVIPSQIWYVYNNATGTTSSLLAGSGHVRYAVQYMKSGNNFASQMLGQPDVSWSAQ
jgi:hypothetical protein